MTSVASQMRRPFSADFSRENRLKLAGARSGDYGGYSGILILFFDKTSLTKTDRCAGELS